MQKNKHIGLRFVMMFMTWLLIYIIACTFSSCGASLVQKGEEITEETNTTATNTQTTTNNTRFDRSIIDQNQKEYVYEPIDPSKAMEIRNAGATTSTTNARKRYTATTTKTQVNKEATEAKKEDAAILATEEVATQTTWFQKLKIAVPWYVYFFGFLMIIIVVALFLVFKKINQITKLPTL